jgi:hypothetical protein
MLAVKWNQPVMVRDMVAMTTSSGGREEAAAHLAHVLFQAVTLGRSEIVEILLAELPDLDFKALNICRLYDSKVRWPSNHRTYALHITPSAPLDAAALSCATFKPIGTTPVRAGEWR